MQTTSYICDACQADLTTAPVQRGRIVVNFEWMRRDRTSSPDTSPQPTATFVGPMHFCNPLCVMKKMHDINAAQHSPAGSRI